jgi:trans-2,3-dihydro-3-hydroxyanthranilate isomerase
VRKLSYAVVDVFTDRALAGNPLAVFTNATGLDAATMQALARETNLSETAFLLPAEQGGTARVRIFTPLAELPFAGHPLVGTAYVIGRGTPVATVHLETGVGIVPVEIERDGGFVTRCAMTQPAPTFSPAGAGRLAAALGIGELRGTAVLADNGVRSLLVPVADVDALAPSMEALAGFEADTIAAYQPPRDGVVEVRVFAPAVGVPEDPATGAVAGPLAVHLLVTGEIRSGRLVIEQGRVLRRPSRIEVDVEPGAPPRVGGPCVPVARGTFEIPEVR